MIKFAEFKKVFFFLLIGSLVVSALVAVVTVLTGDFNETTGKVLFTLMMVVIHSLVCLMFIWNNDRQDTFNTLVFFTDVLFVLIALSFFTSIFGIWKIIDGDMVRKLYQTFFVVGFASLHGDILSKILRKEMYMDVIIYVNYFFIAVVALMFQPLIYVKDIDVLGEFYPRVLGAAGIIDGTLTVLMIIFYKLYTHKHPELVDSLVGGNQPGQPKKRGWSIWVWILIIYLFVQMVLPMFFYGLSYGMSRF